MSESDSGDTGNTGLVHDGLIDVDPSHPWVEVRPGVYLDASAYARNYDASIRWVSVSNDSSSNDSSSNEDPVIPVDSTDNP